MAYPPSWRRAAGDRGTATAVLLRRPQAFLGYLNITPRQSSETLSGWSSFRIKHNAEEGDRDVRPLAVAQGLHFRTGRGSCVRDSYTTGTGVRYVELACLVSGTRGSTVIVGAAPPANWSSVSPAIERAISALIT